MWEWQSFSQITHCFRALLHFVHSSARLSQDIVSIAFVYLLRRHLYIVGEGGRLFSSPIPAHRRNATILHTADMTQPSQSALSKLRVHTGKTSTRQDISVGYFVLPVYAQDTADASQVECVEPSLLPGICSPCIAAIQQCAGKTGIVGRHLCLHRPLVACPHSSHETRELKLPSQSSCRSLHPRIGCTCQ